MLISELVHKLFEGDADLAVGALAGQDALGRPVGLAAEGRVPGERDGEFVRGADPIGGGLGPVVVDAHLSMHGGVEPAADEDRARRGAGVEEGEAAGLGEAGAIGLEDMVDVSREGGGVGIAEDEALAGAGEVDDRAGFVFAEGFFDLILRDPAALGADRERDPAVGAVGSAAGVEVGLVGEEAALDAGGGREAVPLLAEAGVYGGGQGPSLESVAELHEQGQRGLGADVEVDGFIGRWHGPVGDALDDSRPAVPVDGGVGAPVDFLGEVFAGRDPLRRAFGDGERGSERGAGDLVVDFEENDSLGEWWRAHRVTFRTVWVDRIACGSSSPWLPKQWVRRRGGWTADDSLPVGEAVDRVAEPLHCWGVMADQQAMEPGLKAVARVGDAAGERGGRGELAIADEQDVGATPFLVVEPRDGRGERGVDVGAAVEGRCQEVEERDETSRVEAEGVGAHVAGAAEGIELAEAFLLGGAAHGFEGDRLGDLFGQASHRAGCIEADDDGSALGSRALAGLGDGAFGLDGDAFEFGSHPMVGEQRALGAAGMPEFAQDGMGEQRGFRWEHAVDAITALDATGLGGGAGGLDLSEFVFGAAQLDEDGLKGVLGVGLLLHAAKGADQLAQGFEAADEVVETAHLKPAVVPQDAVGEVPAEAEVVAQLAEDFGEAGPDLDAREPGGAEAGFEPVELGGFGLSAGFVGQGGAGGFAEHDDIAGRVELALHGEAAVFDGALAEAGALSLAGAGARLSGIDGGLDGAAGLGFEGGEAAGGGMGEGGVGFVEVAEEVGEEGVDDGGFAAAEAGDAERGDDFAERGGERRGGPADGIGVRDAAGEQGVAPSDESGAALVEAAAGVGEHSGQQRGGDRVDEGIAGVERRGVEEVRHRWRSRPARRGAGRGSRERGVRHGRRGCARLPMFVSGFWSRAPRSHRQSKGGLESALRGS